MTGLADVTCLFRFGRRVDSSFAKINGVPCAGPVGRSDRQQHFVAGGIG